MRIRILRINDFLNENKKYLFYDYDNNYFEKYYFLENSEEYILKEYSDLIKNYLNKREIDIELSFQSIDLTDNLNRFNLELNKENFSLFITLTYELNKKVPSIFINDAIILEKDEKLIFFGFVDKINQSVSVDNNLIVNISASSYTKFFKTSMVIIREAILNKIFLEKRDLLSYKNQTLVPFANFFIDKKTSEIFDFILTNFFFLNKYIKDGKVYYNFNFNHFIKKSREIVNNDSNTFLFPLFLKLLYSHYILGFSNNDEVIFVDFNNIYPFLNMIENFNLTDAVYMSPWSILTKIANNLYYEFYETSGNRLVFKPMFKNYFYKDNNEYYEIKMDNIVSYEISRFNPEESNIKNAVVAADLIGALNPYTNRTFFDFNMIFKNGVLYNNEVIVSPLGRDFDSLYKLCKTEHIVNLVTNLNKITLNLSFEKEDDEWLNLMEIGNFYKINIWDYLNLAYLNSFSLEYSVDSNIEINLDFMFTCSEFFINSINSLIFSLLTQVERNKVKTGNYKKEEKEKIETNIKVNLYYLLYELYDILIVDKVRAEVEKFINMLKKIRFDLRIGRADIFENNMFFSEYNKIIKEINNYLEQNVVFSSVEKKINNPYDKTISYKDIADILKEKIKFVDRKYTIKDVFLKFSFTTEFVGEDPRLKSIDNTINIYNIIQNNITLRLIPMKINDNLYVSFDNFVNFYKNLEDIFNNLFKEIKNILIIREKVVLNEIIENLEIISKLK